VNDSKKGSASPNSLKLTGEILIAWAAG
jgi:hypothetical protein